jgi:hypothetical protein
MISIDDALKYSKALVVMGAGLWVTIKGDMAAKSYSLTPGVEALALCAITITGMSISITAALHIAFFPDLEEQLESNVELVGLLPPEEV